MDTVYNLLLNNVNLFEYVVLCSVRQLFVSVSYTIIIQVVASKTVSNGKFELPTQTKRWRCLKRFVCVVPSIVT